LKDKINELTIPTDEECRLLECYAVSLVRPAFQRNVSPPSSSLIISSQRARLLVTANVVPSSPIPVTLMIETILSSEMSVLARVTQRHIPEGGHSS
jgi:hypothetical protein